MTEGAALFLGPVGQALPAGMPFTAAYDETEADTSGGPPKQVLAGTVYVDREGRTRNEDRTAGVVQIMDPVARTMTHLDLRTGRVRFRMPIPEMPPAAMAPAPHANADAPRMPPGRAEDLGEREIEGLICRGSRLTVEREGATTNVESWQSSELGLIVRSRSVSGGRERTFRLTAIRRGDPDPRLFANDE